VEKLNKCFVILKRYSLILITVSYFTMTNIFLYLLILSVFYSSHAVLVLFDSPPRGYNTFDAYGYSNLNNIGVDTVIRQLASSPISEYGYTMIYGFSGWANTLNETSGEWLWHLDEYGLPIPAPERFSPGSMKEASVTASTLGLKFGLWHIRGIHSSAAAMKLPVKGMEQYTLDQLVDIESVGGGKNGSCLWNPDWLGVNTSHPAAQAYYDAVVSQLVSFGASVIEMDCMMCEPCYRDEMILFTEAVRKRPEPIILYYSPGGGNTPEDSQWVAQNQMASFYRTITDFHGQFYDWGGLQEIIFIAGNFTTASPSLFNANGTWPDLDQLPMDINFWLGSDEVELRDRGQLIATLWMIGRYPLFSAGLLPLDLLTVEYLTNPIALSINARQELLNKPTRIIYNGNCTCVGNIASCIIPHGPDDHPGDPCISKWAAYVPSSNFTAFAIFNIGEDIALSISTSFDELGLQSSPQDRYRIIDVWTSVVIGDFSGDEVVVIDNLRKHASIFYQIYAIL
jgi:alpha-galactosidase